MRDKLERARRRAAAGGQPPPLKELRREFLPELGFKVEHGEHFEFVDDELRIIPIAEVEWPGGGRKLIFYPEAPTRRA